MRYGTLFKKMIKLFVLISDAYLHILIGKHHHYFLSSLVADLVGIAPVCVSVYVLASDLLDFFLLIC